MTSLSALVWLVVPLGLRSLLDAVFEQSNRGLLNQLAAGLLVLFLLQAIFSFFGYYLLECEVPDQNPFAGQIHRT